jgi:Putative transposase
MKSWRKAVIALLRATLRAGQLQMKMTVDQTKAMLTQQEQRWWSVKIQSFQDKWHFLQYAGRYVRRPPIAQRRITRIGERTVGFWVKDKRLGRRVEKECSVEEFIDRWAQHIPERYQHAVQSFGLFAPRALGQTSAGIFAILGQERKPRPKPRPWADSIKRDFLHDPLLDHTGKGDPANDDTGYVKYVPELLPFPDNFDDLSQAGHASFARQAVFTKFADWTYEHEIRVWGALKNKEGEFYFVNFSADLELKEVIIGQECTLPITALAHALGSMADHVTVKKARAAHDKFEMVEDQAFE